MFPSISILSAVRFGQMDHQFFRREVALQPFIQDTGIMAEVDKYAVLLDNLGKITNSVRTPSFAKHRDSREYIIGFGSWSTGTVVYSSKYTWLWGLG